MEIKKIKYPSDDFYKFGISDYAVDIDNEQIEEWVNECVENVKRQLENKVESPYAFKASGNTMVICFFSQDIEEDVFDDNNYFSVVVAKNYESADFFIEDIKEKNKDEEISYLKKQIKELQEEIKKMQEGEKNEYF